MRKALLVLSIMVAASLFITAAFASVNDDQVTSQKIREADGTSGQNTNSGSGVKTGHIQNGAVTNAKIGGMINIDKLATYAGIKIVHAGLANGVDTFNTINDALNSITTPDQQTVIRIMPGTYSAPNPFIANVVFEGSGKENTILLGRAVLSMPAVFRNLYIDGIDTYASITLDNVICNSWMYQRSSDPNVIANIKDSVLYNLSSMSMTNIENSAIKTAVESYGHAYIKNSTIGFSLILSGTASEDSTIMDTVVGISASPGSREYAIGIFNFSGVTAQTTLSNVRTMNAQTGVWNNHRVALSVNGSSLEGTQYGIQIGSPSVRYLNNSTIAGTDAAIQINTNNAIVQVANSRLIGPVLNASSAILKMFNCYDGDINPIPNM